MMPTEPSACHPPRSSPTLPAQSPIQHEDVRQCSCISNRSVQSLRKLLFSCNSATTLQPLFIGVLWTVFANVGKQKFPRLVSHRTSWANSHARVGRAALKLFCRIALALRLLGRDCCPGMRCSSLWDTKYNMLRIVLVIVERRTIIEPSTHPARWQTIRDL